MATDRGTKGTIGLLSIRRVVFWGQTLFQVKNWPTKVDFCKFSHFRLQQQFRVSRSLETANRVSRPRRKQKSSVLFCQCSVFLIVLTSGPPQRDFKVRNDLRVTQTCQRTNPNHLSCLSGRTRFHFPSSSQSSVLSNFFQVFVFSTGISNIFMCSQCQLGPPQLSQNIKGGLCANFSKIFCRISKSFVRHLPREVMVVQWIELLPHNPEDPGSNPGPDPNFYFAFFDYPNDFLTIFLTQWRHLAAFSAFQSPEFEISNLRPNDKCQRILPLPKLLRN